MNNKTHFGNIYIKTILIVSFKLYCDKISFLICVIRAKIMLQTQVYLISIL